MINFNCIKDITKKLRETYKGIQSNSYGYCCCTCYSKFHKYVNENDYVCAKIFKYGLNSDYNRESGFNLGKQVYFVYKLTIFDLDNVIETMQEVAKKYGYEIVKPQSKHDCIILKEVI